MRYAISWGPFPPTGLCANKVKATDETEIPPARACLPSVDIFLETISLRSRITSTRSEPELSLTIT